MMDDPMRQTYRSLTDREEEQLHDIKALASRLYHHIDVFCDGREGALAKTKVEEAVMWATKYITGPKD